MEREARESAEGWVVVEEMIGGRREGARWQADRDQLPPWSAAAESGGRQEEAGRAAGMAAAETAAEVMARNKHSRPDALSTFVHINKNKSTYKPLRDETFKAYRSKFGKVMHHGMHV